MAFKETSRVNFLEETMPESFKTTYPTTRCIIDCTELYGQRPSSLSMQSSIRRVFRPVQLVQVEPV